VAWASLKSWTLLLVLAEGMGVSASALADGPSVAVRVDPQSREPCAEGPPFLEELEAKDPNVRAAAPNERAPLLMVHITRTPRGTAHGRLVIEDTDGAVSRREVDGATCESVLSALALMSAVAVDPRAPTSSGVATGSSRTAESSGSTASEPHAEGPSGRTTEVVAHEQPAPAADRAEDSTPQTTSSGRAHISFAGGVGATTATAKAVVLLVPVSVDVAWGGASRRPAPMLRVGFEHTDSGDDAATGGAARFVLNAGTIDACARLPLLPRFDVSPCIRAEGGVLASTGVDIVPARSDTRPWIALGAVGAVRYRVVWHLFAELLIGFDVPLVRDRYFFEPDTPVFRPPPIAAIGSAGLGLTFP
jgi:hypothetical protein